MHPQAFAVQFRSLDLLTHQLGTSLFLPVDREKAFSFFEDREISSRSLLTGSTSGCLILVGAKFMRSRIRLQHKMAGYTHQMEEQDHTLPSTCYVH